MHRLDLDISIAWEGTWHVGSGFAMAQADRLIQRRGGRHGSPLVPGSQLKGVLRHHVERLVASLGFQVVAPHAIDSDQEIELVQHFRPLPSSRLVVDRLFGTRYQGECLYIDDALPPPGTTMRRRDHRLVARTAMDRVTGTVREKRLFVTEVAEGFDLILHSRIRGRHPLDALTTVENGSFPLEYALMLAALLSIDALGGDKGVGQGRCRMEILGESVRYNDRDWTLSQALSGLFDPGEWVGWINLYDEERSQR
jgi:CRISPR/Cas system CSM-associated protein Csm3 (group 7 of RAMP superfamily)